MTRDEKCAKATGLREGGQSYQQIGERLGAPRTGALARSYGYRLVHNERTKREARDWKASNKQRMLAYDVEYGRRLDVRGKCVECNGPMGFRVRHDGLCSACQTLRKEAKWRAMEKLWAEGLKIREIAAALGCSKGMVQVELDRARKAGFTFPYRRRTMRGKVLA